MRLPPSQGAIRKLLLLLWILSLGMAAFLPWSLLSNLDSREHERASIAAFYDEARTDLARLRSGLHRVRLNPGGGQLGHRQVAAAAMRLQPQRPQPPGSSAETTSSEAGRDAGDDHEAREGGPLGEDWEYAGGLFIADDPSRSRVWLRRKEDPNRLRSRYSARNRSRLRRSSSRIARRTSSRRTARSRLRQPKEIISFYAAEDEFKDEELEVEFLIRSVNWDEIVYSPSEDPEEKYVLERVDDSPYAFSEQKRLAPFAEEPEEGEKDVAEDQPEDEKHFRIRARGYVNRVEEDYRRLIRGDVTDSGVRPVRARPSPDAGLND